ncbi:hypothetical protein [Flavobacterium sp.]|uniref:hypothetical protein n=1 Tax=Flavobacterium sp. TaxID=239 RepID=UPI002487478D|nr:hypothetical protein [Flavobacterium sp.]MDI1317791.1 hypothetical protein [Flavobacterium sp.]
MFLILTQLCVGQKTYKVRQGELQYVAPQFGPVIKNGNQYYRFEFFNYSQKRIGFQPKLTEVSPDEFEKIKSDSDVILSNAIFGFDLNAFGQLKFTTPARVYEFYSPYLYQYNNELLTIKLKDNNGLNHHKTFPFLLLDFGNGKTILYSNEVSIINTNSNLKFLFKDNRMTAAYKNYQTEKLDKTKGNELFIDSYNPAAINGGLYFTDTIKRRKIVIKNVFGKKVIQKSFDSVQYNDFFMVGLNGKDIDIYNYAFKNLNLNGVTAFKFIDYSPILAVIYNNELKKLNVLGNNFKSGDFPLRNNFEGSLPRSSTLFNIIKENNEFYFYSDYIQDFLSNAEMKSFDYKSKVYHIENVTEIEYYGESDRKMEMDDTKKPFIIYTKLKSGKYNLNTID